MKKIRIKFANRPFRAMRGADGVPRIQAATFVDALYGLGYLHAMDRPTQLLFSRTLASGRAAELIAGVPEMVETDGFFRKVGLYLNLDREVRRLDDRTREQLNAYCEGVNDGMRQTGRSLPMWATGFQPRPWNLLAVMLVCNLLNYGGLAIGQQQGERLILELIHAGIEPKLLQELFEPRLDGVDFDLLRQIKISPQLSDEALELLVDLPRLSGSNAWAVSPARSTSGHALLAADPHLEVNRLPAIWYEVALEWGDSYVLGATLPGSPVFGVGRNRQLSWGVTYIKGDTSDYFIEDCRRFEGAWQYRRGDRWFDFEVREETVHCKGGDPVPVKVYHNGLGTLDMDPDLAGPGYYLLTTWTGDYEGGSKSLSAWLDLLTCRDTLSAMVLVREVPQPTLLWVFADRDGHIGKQASGWFPKRRQGHSGLTPVPAWDTGNHWQGWIPCEQLPGEYNPPEGFVSSANEDISPPGGPRFVTLPVPEYRKWRIVERLRELDSATLDDMRQLQYDVVSRQARDLLKIFLPHLPDGEHKQRLAAWDCSYEPESTEATLFAKLYRNVLLEIFGTAPGGIGWRRMLYLCSRVGFSMAVVTSIDRMLLKDESAWWQGRDKGELIRRAGERLEGEDEVPWAEMNAVHFTNRFFESRAVVGRALGFHTGEVPLRGCHATPFQGHVRRAANRESTFAPSYHFVTDLGTDEAWTNLPGGPSESRFSRYYRNDLARWLKAEYKRLALDS